MDKSNIIFKKSSHFSTKLTYCFVSLAVFFLNSCQEREFTNPFDPQVPKTLTTSVLPAGSGKISISPESSSYKSEEVVTLVPEPNQHWVFKNWQGDAVGSAIPLSVTMSTNKSVVAIFTKRNYPLTLTMDGDGTVSERIVFTPTGREYPHGTIVELTPIPKQGWLFDSWSGDLTGKNVPQNITVDNPKSVKAKFVQQQISNLACASALNSGNLVATLPANGVSSAIPYTTLSGGSYPGQSATSTGVTGLTATLSAGSFSPGSGNLTFTITGTPSGVGTASFAISIGGQSCTFTRVVNPLGVIAGLTCGGATNNGALNVGVSASNVSSQVPYTGGNGSAHLGQVVTSTGITGLTATLAPGNFVNGNGTLTYTITGTPSALGNANFVLTIGGQTCSLTRAVTSLTGSITELNCAAASTSGTLNANQPSSGVAGSIPYVGGNSGVHSGLTQTSTGVTGLTLTVNAGTFANGNGTLEYSITGTPSGSGVASFPISIGGRTCTLTRVVNQLVGSISVLNCGSATNSGNLTQGTEAVNVSSSIPYTGGNGGTYIGQTVNSTGVLGLTVTLSAGTFANGNGSLTYILTGTPSGNGTASFALNIGGETCNLTRVVNPIPGSVSSLNCSSATNTGILTQSTLASGVSSLVPYTGGNGGSHTGQTVNSTGVTGLTATLSSGTLANGSGSLTYTLTGTPSGSGTASFALNIGGQTCNLTRVVNTLPVSISTLNCSSATNTGTLTQLTLASGVSSSVPYTGGNGGVFTGQTVNSTGVTGLTATLSTGTLANGSGSLTYTITGTPSGFGSASFALNIGGQSCTLTRVVSQLAGIISALNCISAANTGTLTSGTAASGVSSSVPYTGGNGGYYTGQSVNSTGVTGLTATLASGNFTNGSGSLVYTITGTPSGNGTANFAINQGGQTCTFSRSVTTTQVSVYPPESIFCGAQTAVVPVTNPATGKTWMDRNLGATRPATSLTDSQSYGDLYQWGRRSDGHQCRNSSTTTFQSTSNSPAYGLFIIQGQNYDWRNPKNDGLWQGVNGINNPYPSGYRLPTTSEWRAEINSWIPKNQNAAINSILKLPTAGYRNGVTSNIQSTTIGSYWSSGVRGSLSLSEVMEFGSNFAVPDGIFYRFNGLSVRCIKD